MEIIDLPAFPAPSSIEWQPHQPTQVTRSEFGRATRATIIGGGSYWSAKVDFPVVTGERQFRPWRSALLRVRGRVRCFRISACEGPQHAHYQEVVVDGTGQQGFRLAVRGVLPGTGLRDGMFVTVGDRLLGITADSPLAGPDGKLTLDVEPPLPAGLLNGAAIETRRPWAVMRMTSDAQGWRVAAGQTYTVSFECEEA